MIGNERRAANANAADTSEAMNVKRPISIVLCVLGMSFGAQSFPQTPDASRPPVRALETTAPVLWQPSVNVFRRAT